MEAQLISRGEARPYFHDKILAATLLRLIPQSITPNHFTVLRLLCTPFVIWVLFLKNYTLGLPLFMAVAFTDTIDGSLARTRNQITTWGIFFDPIADKLLIGSVALIVSIQHYHPALIIAALFGDILPPLRGVLVRKYRGVVLSANWWGKWKMILQCASIACLLFGLATQNMVWVDVGEGTLVVATLLAFIAFFTYSL